MIYAIFICIAGGGCHAIPTIQLFDSPQTCVTALRQIYGASGEFKNDRVYTSANEWFECAGKQGWQEVP